MEISLSEIYDAIKLSEPEHVFFHFCNSAIVLSSNIYIQMNASYMFLLENSLSKIFTLQPKELAETLSPAELRRALVTVQTTTEKAAIHINKVSESLQSYRAFLDWIGKKEVVKQVVDTAAYFTKKKCREEDLAALVNFHNTEALRLIGELGMRWADLNQYEKTLPLEVQLD